MKKVLLAICIFWAFVVVLPSCKHGHGGGGGGGGATYTPGGGETAAVASSDATTDYTTSQTATTLEQEVLDEMNFARQNPSQYITDRLNPELTNPYDTSSTYLATLQELINEMQSMSPIGALAWSGRLKQSCTEWVTIQGAGTTAADHGHDPNLFNRIRKYCTSYDIAGENLSYGYRKQDSNGNWTDEADPKQIVIGLLVDDGIADRGHRYNILDYAPKGKDSAGKYTHAGVSIGTHGYYTTMCAINYAGTGSGFVERP